MPAVGNTQSSSRKISRRSSGPSVAHRTASAPVPHYAPTSTGVRRATRAAKVGRVAASVGLAVSAASPAAPPKVNKAHAKKVRVRQQMVAKARKSLRKSSKPTKAAKTIHSLPEAEQRPAKLAVKFGKKYGVAPSLLMSDMRQESGFNPNAVSSAGAFGLSQFIPSTAASYGVKPGSSKKATRSQVRGQAHYLSDLGAAKDPQGALSSYSGGYAASDYNNPVIAGQKDYKKLDKVAKVKGVSTGAKKLPGGWSGSKKAVLKELPSSVRAEGRGDKRTPAENASVGGAENSDHLTTNRSSYAADIPPDAKTYAKLRKRLGLPPATTGEDTVVKDGYRYQLIYGAQYDHADHIHLGAVWVGAGAAPTTSSSGGYSSPAQVAAGVTTGSVASGAPASQAKSRKRKVRHTRRQQELRKAIAGKPAKPTKAIRVSRTSPTVSDVRKQTVQIGL